MTAETDLLPLPPLHIAPSVEPVDYPDVAQALMDYARANVAHATAALQAEVEALRERAERLAEALRRYGVHDQACVAANSPICTCGLDAALEQENDDA